MDFTRHGFGLDPGGGAPRPERVERPRTRRLHRRDRLETHERADRAGVLVRHGTVGRARRLRAARKDGHRARQRRPRHLHPHGFFGSLGSQLDGTRQLEGGSPPAGADGLRRQGLGGAPGRGVGRGADRRNQATQRPDAIPHAA